MAKHIVCNRFNIRHTNLHASSLRNMAGIYIHIPFCKQACHYCNFHFSTGTGNRDAMINAIVKEIELRKHTSIAPIETIYFGGGTPSILDAASIDAMIQAVYKHYRVISHPEITLEANPDDITKAKAGDWKSMGINRFSIGIQSFSNRHLQWMNRAHNGLQSLACIETIRLAGFENFSIDLIYGTPGQSLDDWEKDLEQAIGLQIPHLSCYALTVEQETPLFHLIKKGAKENTSSDLQAASFQLLVSKATSNGYRHYEISNFALPGMESKHNSSYWNGKPYLGFGPSAHSFHDRTRSWNISNNAAYIQSIENNQRSYESEVLSDKDLFNEYIMTHLRLDEGISSNWIKVNAGIDQLQNTERMLLRHEATNHVVKTAEGWKLTAQGKFLADGIAADLFQI